jgi:phosphoribosyl-AMP cyclohydrolase
MTERIDIDFDKEGGLVPAIAQDAETGEILMLAWMNREALQETLRTRRACYFSRSRNRLWRKGEESGNHQDVVELYTDCDRDVLVLKVRQHGGAACHEGYRSCFYRKADGDRWSNVGTRVFDPEDVYKGSAGKSPR